MALEDGARFLRERHDVTKFVWAIAIGWVAFGTIAPPTDLLNVYQQIGFGIVILFAMIATGVWEWIESRREASHYTP